MTDTETTDADEAEMDADDQLKTVAIEDNLPLKTVGIENLKEGNPKHMPPNRYIHPWFARRPTPASRLAVLASTLPSGIDADTLLEWMQVGPKEHIDQTIPEYVASKKASEDDRGSDTLAEHYGYQRSFKSSPSQDQLDDIHSLVRDQWGGELPTVLDAAAGGGTIPFEALRYGFPTKANELNPVPALILKAMLEYAPSVGSLEDDVKAWGEKINETAAETLADYYPSDADGQTPSHYACTYAIKCPSCGCHLPVAGKWWLKKKDARTGVAVRPQVDGTDVTYERVELPEDVEKDEFNPQDGPYGGGGVECLSCTAVTEWDDAKQLIKDGDFEYELVGVKYTNEDTGSGYRAPTEADREALARATEEVDSDFSLLTHLSTRVEEGNKTRELHMFGMDEWRDVFAPRQLISHHTYLQAFEEHADDIRAEHDAETAEAILTVLALATSKFIDRNTRLSPYSIGRGYPENAAGGKNFSFQRYFVDNNPTAGDQAFLDMLYKGNKSVLNSYERLVEYLETADPDPAELTSGDAAALPYDDDSIQVVAIDPPYYSSIMYAELSDLFYPGLKTYLEDIHPDLFTEADTNKDDEAVANPARFDDIVGDGESKKQLARQHYQDKMSAIFNELYRVLEPGGVMTVMFTHKETDAWDTLTQSLVNSGFTVTATHPITSEMPDRMDVQDNNSADSTILLTGRKPVNPTDPDSREPALWKNVREETRAAAEEAAKDMLDSGLSLTKTDIIIAAFGPTLQVYADNYPVVDKRDDKIPPRKALKVARKAVTQVMADRYLDSEGFDDLDELTTWYVFSWLVYDRDTFPYDEGHQLGLGVGVDIDDIKNSTKIWGKKKGDIQLKTRDYRVQDIHKLEAGEEVSSQSHPVDPRRQEFNYDIDAVHAALHIYEKKGADAAWEWLTDRNLHTSGRFVATLSALLQVLPEDHPTAETARDLTAGKTGDLLDIDAEDISMNTDRETQETKLDEYQG